MKCVCVFQMSSGGNYVIQYLNWNLIHSFLVSLPSLKYNSYSVRWQSANRADIMIIVCWICSMYICMYIVWENIYNLINEITIIWIHSITQVLIIWHTVRIITLPIINFLRLKLIFKMKSGIILSRIIGVAIAGQLHYGSQKSWDSANMKTSSSKAQLIT